MEPTFVPHMYSSLVPGGSRKRFWLESSLEAALFHYAENTGNDSLIRHIERAALPAFCQEVIRNAETGQGTENWQLYAEFYIQNRQRIVEGAGLSVWYAFGPDDPAVRLAKALDLPSVVLGEPMNINRDVASSAAGFSLDDNDILFRGMPDPVMGFYHPVLMPDLVVVAFMSGRVLPVFTVQQALNALGKPF